MIPRSVLKPAKHPANRCAVSGLQSSLASHSFLSYDIYDVYPQTLPVWFILLQPRDMLTGDIGILFHLYH